MSVKSLGNNRLFIYHGCRLTLNEIAARKKMSYKTLNSRLDRRSISALEDITHLVDASEQELYYAARIKYLYKGELLTLQKIAGASGIKVDTLRNRVKSRKCLGGDDITKICAKKLKSLRAKGYVFESDILSAAGIAKRLKTRPGMVYNRLANDHNPGDNVSYFRNLDWKPLDG